MKKSLLAALAVIALTAASAAKADENHAPVKILPAMQKLHSLAGTWTGKNMMDGKEVDMQVKYRVTSAGTAVEETLFPGTPHEMVSVYFQAGNDVLFTHYCAMGNQPRMKLVSTKGDKLKFEEIAADTTGLPSPDAPRMGSLLLTMKGKDKIIADWGMSGQAEGKKMSSFAFTREK